MINAFRSEWLKIRTVRANLVLFSLAIAVPAILGTLVAAFADMDQSDSGDRYMNTVLGPAFIQVMLCGVLGVLGIGQEYRHSTIRTTFAAEPRRGRVYSAKILLTALMATGIGVLSTGLSFVGAKIAFEAHDQEMSMTSPGENLTATIGLVVLCGLFALFGLAVGTILRQPAGAIPALLIWALIVETIVAGLLGIWSDAAPKFLPIQSGFELPSTGFDNPDAFGRLGSGLYFGAWTAAMLFIGWLLIERRDA